MSRSKTRPDARREVRPIAVAPDAVSLQEISESAFHRAIQAATAHSNMLAGETFATPDAVLVRVNDRHFRIDGPSALTHPDILRLVGKSAIWKRGGGR